MNTNFNEIDLLQKYRQSISKRYRGYNRVYQLNVNKLTQVSTSKQALGQKQIKQPPKSPIVQIAKHCLSQNNYKGSYAPQAIVIRSTNAQFNFKEINSQTQVNRKRFVKTKFMKQSQKYSENQTLTQKSSRNQQHKETAEDEVFQNKFKFRKRYVKEIGKQCNSEECDYIGKNYDMVKFVPFSPVIRGQKKNTHIIQNKKSKTENEALFKQEERQRLQRNATTHQTSQETQNKTKMKRSGSFISQKSESIQVKKSLCSSVQQSKFIKKFSHNFKSSNQVQQKPSKLQFPKISHNINSPTKLRQSNNNNSPSDIDNVRNKQKSKKTPILMRYQFDVKNIDSQSFVVIQADSQTMLYGHRYNNPYEIASLTKIMTFWVVLKIVEEYQVNIREEMVSVEHLSSDIGGTSADLFPGEVYTVQNLLYGLMLPSGNDAALSLAAWAGKFKALNPQDAQTCISEFVSLMNKQAKNLNLNDTRFGNPHGLPHRLSRSTALDVAKLSIECMKNQIFKKVVKTKLYKCVALTKQGKKRLNQWHNTNKLLRRQGFIGIKTGITITAGPCLTSAYTFRDKTYICVVLRAKKISRRFKQTRKILHWCLTKLYGQTLTNEETLVLKKLKKNNADLDSDYSQDQSIFRYDVNNLKELRKRCDIISEM